MDGETRGLKHVRIALQDLPFPTTRSDLLARAGSWRMPMTGVEFVPLAELLDGTRHERYHDVDALLRDVARAHPDVPRE